MSLITETPRISDVLLFEVGIEMNLVRTAITLASGLPISVVGQVLGQITKAVPTAVAKVGITGAGTVTALSNGPNAKLGAYILTFLTATTFTVSDPSGTSLPNGVNGAYTDAQINFTVTAGSPAFIAGDSFTITVAAGSGSFVQVTPAAVDGSQNAAGILLTPEPVALVATASAVAVTIGPAILKLNGIAYTAAMTTGQKTTALAQLLALGIQVRTDYGV
jgi:hypothetical protein